MKTADKFFAHEDVRGLIAAGQVGKLFLKIVSFFVLVDDALAVADSSSGELIFGSPAEGAV